MTGPSRRVVQWLLGLAGYRLVPHRRGALGLDAFIDIQRLLTRPRRPVIFDVGAHFGESVRCFRRRLPTATVHAFEPEPAAFRELASRMANLDDVHAHPVGAGPAAGEAVFRRNEQSDMSSFLPAGQSWWGRIVEERPVQVTTVQEYCRGHGIDRIDVLKTDTQGYDLEVLRGAEELLAADRIETVLVELTFTSMYQGASGFDEVCRYLLDRRFRFVSLYHIEYEKRFAGWADALFLNPAFAESLRTGQ